MAHYMTTSSENKLRVFSPVILFHDHQFVKDSTGGLEHVHIPCDDPYYGQLIETHKTRIQQMLRSNGRFWSDFRVDQLEAKQVTSPVPSLASSPTPPLHSYDEPPSPSIPSRRYYHPYRRYHPSNTPRRHSTASHNSQHHMMMLPTAAGSVMGGDNISISSSSTIPSLPESPPPAVSVLPANDIPRRAKQPAPLIKRRRGNLPKAVTAILRDWLSRHKKHPYPTEDEKLALATQTSLTLNQISNWFINARRRILQPMLQKEQQERILGRVHEENDDEEEDDDDDDEEHSLDTQLYDNARRGRKRSASSDRYMPPSRPRRTGHATAAVRRR